MSLFKQILESRGARIAGLIGLLAAIAKLFDYAFPEIVRWVAITSLVLVGLYFIIIILQALVRNFFSKLDQRFAKQLAPVAESVSDFEDAIQVCSAKKESITTIVTRDESDFIKSGFSEVLLADGLERVLLRPGKNWNEASVPLLSHSLFIKLFEGQEFRSGFVGCFFGISGFTFHIFK